ncbi:GNAT family N-acetyltransferase [Ferrovibrio sp.]|uniref:GNAT family N-acetyltransferase n=1 Tax=Ferrovibrio sp. TaxID=1917215 RepID=UPI001B60D09A|nr:GNAT family N-acetyltransferase [Ferrovibrio sp.]MBP7064542.1 GNAT family N-acetyltransferase [Ferrovibrio sp.]
MRILPLHAINAAERSRLCHRFHAEVALAAFPMAAELETAEAWLDRMTQPGADNQPILHMHLALDDAAEKPAIAGGLLVEIYPASRCILFTYIAVAPAYRGQRLAHRLVQAAEQALAAAGYGDCPILAEAEDPARVGAAAHSANLDLGLRLRILKALGFVRTDFPYVQPALAPEKAPVDWLFLLVLQRSLPGGMLPASRLAAFLVEFFASLDNHPDNARHLAVMQNWLAKRDTLAFHALA